MTQQKTPGTLYAVRQVWPYLRWHVVPIDEAQGRAMRARGEPHVYDTLAQAHAVRSRLNQRRDELLQSAER